MMFARFRDENATAGSGLNGPVMPRAPDSDAIGPGEVRLLRLRDGRQLAWAEYGSRHGYPILYMHRQGGCRLEAAFFDELARAAGFRLIAVDRPGLGASDFTVMHSVDAVTDDSVQLVHQLGLRQFGLLAWGSGSAFALSLAKKLPERCSFAALFAPVEQPCRWAGNTLVRSLFTAAVRALVSIRRLVSRRDTSLYSQRWRDQLSRADRKYSDNPAVLSLMQDISSQAVIQGSAGLAQDIWLGLTGCAPQDSLLSMPVHVWGARPASAADGVVHHYIRTHGQLIAGYVASDLFEVLRSVQRQICVSPNGGDLTHR